MNELNLELKNHILMQNLSFLFQEITKRNHALSNYQECTKDSISQEYYKREFFEAEQNIKQVLGL
jgi:hypothetical protein